MVEYKGKKFEPFIYHDLIDRVISSLAEKVTADLSDKKPIFLVVLNGAFMFAADLMRHLDFDCEVCFIRMSSYEGTESTGKVKEELGIEQSLKGRSVVIVEDIVDSGTTLDELMELIPKFEPAELKIATFLMKPENYHKKHPVDYVALRIPNEFVLGYGLDYDGYGRNLKDLYKLYEPES